MNIIELIGEEKIISFISYFARLTGAKVSIGFNHNYFPEIPPLRVDLKEPIIVDNEVMGFFYVWDAKNNEALNHFIQSISEIFASLISGKKMLETLKSLSERHHRELLFFNNLNFMLLKEFTLEAMSLQLLQNVADIMEIKQASIMHYNIQENVLEIVAHIGHERDITNIKQPIDQGISGWVFQNKHPVFVKTLSDLPDILRHKLRTLPDGKDHLNQPLVCIPLIIDQKVIGILNLTGKVKGTLDEDDYRFVNTISAQISTMFSYAAMIAEVQTSQSLRDEMEIAETIQKNILPKEVPNSTKIQITSFFNAAAYVGGDYYDFFSSENGALNIIVSDVSGHGVGPALMMSTFRGFNRALLFDKAPLEDQVKKINYLTTLDTKSSGTFITSFFMRYFEENDTFEYISNGHNDILFYNSATTSIELLPSSSVPLGIMDEISFEKIEKQVQPGDMLVIYTDGLTEAENFTGEMFELKRLSTILQTYAHLSSQEVLEQIYTELKEFIGIKEQMDDITILTVKFL